MSYVTTMVEAFEQIGPSFSFAPFAEILQPPIEAVLAEQGLNQKVRKGTRLIPKVLIWVRYPTKSNLANLTK